MSSSQKRNRSEIKDSVGQSRVGVTDNIVLACPDSTTADFGMRSQVVAQAELHVSLGECVEIAANVGTIIVENLIAFFAFAVSRLALESRAACALCHHAIFCKGTLLILLAVYVGPVVLDITAKSHVV